MSDGLRLFLAGLPLAILLGVLSALVTNTREEPAHAIVVEIPATSSPSSTFASSAPAADRVPLADERLRFILEAAATEGVIGSVDVDRAKAICSEFADDGTSRYNVCMIELTGIIGG